MILAQVTLVIFCLITYDFNFYLFVFKQKYLFLNHKKNTKQKVLYFKL